MGRLEEVSDSFARFDDPEELQRQAKSRFFAAMREMGTVDSIQNFSLKAGPLFDRISRGELYIEEEDAARLPNLRTSGIVISEEFLRASNFGQIYMFEAMKMRGLIEDIGQFALRCAPLVDLILRGKI